MKQFLLSEKYRLDLRWKKVVYEKDGVCELIGASFSGPVLSIADQINPNDHIMLDFYSQYVVIVSNVYVAKLSWEDVVYENNIVYLKNAKITHDTELNKVPKLNDVDYLVIDTKNHESDKHRFNLTYPTYVINEANEMCNFNKGD